LEPIHAILERPRPRPLPITGVVAMQNLVAWRRRRLYIRDKDFVEFSGRNMLMSPFSDLPRLARAALVLLLCLGAAACGKNRVTTANYDKITEGMTLGDVEAILGKGERESGDAANVAAQVGVDPNMGGQSGSGTAKPFVWEHGNKKITIHFVNDKVLTKHQIGLK
jgi:hypothetical protein